MMLGKIFGTICLTFAPVDFKLSLSNAIEYPIKRISIAFDHFCFTAVLVTIPIAALLSIAIITTREILHVIIFFLSYVHLTLQYVHVL